MNTRVFVSFFMRNHNLCVRTKIFEVYVSLYEYNVDFVPPATDGFASLRSDINIEIILILRNSWKSLFNGVILKMKHPEIP